MIAREMNSNSRAKQNLGKLIRERRIEKGLTQRGLAHLCDQLPNSNLKYIEDGINAPSPKIYELIIDNLELSEKKQAELDKLYTEVRQIPPPDICKIIISNQAINKSLRLLSSKKLTTIELAKIEKCFESIANNKREDGNETI